MKAVVQAPTPVGVSEAALHQHFERQVDASRRLGDMVSEESVTRAWAAAMPKAVIPRNGLANIMRDQRRFDEAIRWRNEAIGLAPHVTAKAVLRVRLAQDLMSAGSLDEPLALVDAIQKEVLRLRADRTWDVQGEFNLHAAMANAGYVESALQQRRGRIEASIEAARTAEGEARSAAMVAKSLNAIEVRNANTLVAICLARWAQALRAAGRLSESERVLADYVALSRAVELLPTYRIGILLVASGLRTSQREFKSAEAMAREAVALHDALGFPANHPSRVTATAYLISALVGQGRWATASSELEGIERLALENPTLKGATRIPLERGLIYLHTGRATEAAAVFDEMATRDLQGFSESQIQLAQARGLHGVALWRTSDPTLRAVAIGRLKESVRSYMLPANADQVERVGLRRMIREMIFSAYLEALSTTPGEDAVEALGPADWVLGGVVQEAVLAASARAGFVEPALSELVRAEQDVRNEIRILDLTLSQEQGLRPDVISALRARVAVLESERSDLQLKIRSGHPDYDRLMRPQPPSVPELMNRLGPDDALLILQPSDESVYAWVVTNGMGARFVRVALSRGAVRGLAERLRRSIELSATGKPVTPFDVAASSDLYQRLLQPFEAELADKQHLVVAAGGELGQIPFGMLRTRPGNDAGERAPWLIRRLAVSQVPSASAWLAARRLASVKLANEPLMAWGDPRFGPVDGGLSVTVRSVVADGMRSASDLRASEVRGSLNYAGLPPLPETR